MNAPKIETVELSKLVPWTRNPRKNHAVDAIAKSIDKFGALAPIIVQAGTYRILAGHGRLEAYKKRGAKEVTVVVADLSDRDADLYTITDNKLTERAEWDGSKLAELLGEFKLEALDLSLTGFDEAEIFDLLNPSGAVKEAPLPPLPAEAVSKPGDLWELGRHRLLCGDSSKPEDVARVLQGASVSMLLSDPPYGMNLTADWSGVLGSKGSLGQKGENPGIYHENVIGDDVPFDPAPLFSLYGSPREVFLFGGDYFAKRLPDGGSWLVWDKRKESQADAIGSEFELIWSKQKHKRRVLRHEWFGFLSPQNSSEARARVHPTQKPTSLLVDLMMQWGKRDDVIADPYAGSGSTIAAAEQIGRRCLAIEISPGYVDVAVIRWQNLTKQKAKNLTRPGMSL